MSKLDELLDSVDSALYDWAEVREFYDLTDELINDGKWVLHYAKTKGWYL